MSKSTAILNTKAPFSTATGKESLDLVLAMGTFEQSVGLFFVGDGVFQLLQGQKASNLDAKEVAKTLQALPFYDIDDVFVCQKSLEERGINGAQLCLSVEVLPSDELTMKLSQYDHVVTF